jgi:C1A family cysteine protease
MKKIVMQFAFILLLVSGTLSLITREEYDEATKHVEFEVLEYEKVVEIFQDIKPRDPDVARKNFLENKIFMASKYKEQLENQNFMALETGQSLPKEFNWVNVRPGCFSPPLHQKNCGSCYIFSTVTVLEARICIQSQGQINPILSPQDVLSCGTFHDKCDGGTLRNAWDYLEDFGTCSLQCKPYVSGDGSVPKCKDSCDNKEFSFKRWKAVKNSLKIILRNNEAIKREIYQNGPVSTQMETWEDLSLFKGGIYIHSWGKSTNGHGISIVGWGYSEIHKKEYWILRNSWGTDWGDNGYFKVLFDNYDIIGVITSSPLI